MSNTSSQQKKTTTPNTENTWKPVIPTVAFPLKPKSNNNKNVLQKYFNNLAGDPSARFLFNESGLWHQGIHLRAEKFKSSEFDNQQICAIADGELIAYKVDSSYKMEDEDAGASYSTGFFLLEHHLEYPKDNKLTFYSFYRHTAELKKYDATVSKILGETKSADKYPVMIRNEHNQATGKTLPDGVVLEVRKNHHNKTHYDELIWYKDKVTNQEVRPEKGRWKIYSKSYRVMIEESLPAIPLLAENGIETQTDKEVALANPIKVKAGDVLGLMGEYNQTEENGKRLLHLEVFTYDDIEAFRNKAKEAYQQDKKQDKEKRSLPDNFLYVDRNQPYYSLVGKEPTQIGETQTEIFVPLSELEKKSVKVKDDQGKEISKDYYNIQPYLHQSTTNSNVGIYVDDSHLTQGITFPGMNVFTTQSNGVDIFDQTLCHYLNPDEKDLESKERLNPLFKAIMEELDLDKEKGEPVRFEAGRLHQLSLDAIQHRRFIGIIPKHQNEWASNRVQQFEKLCRVFIDQNQAKTAQQIRKRVGDLSIQLKVRSFDTDKEAYFIHPLGLIGALIIKPLLITTEMVNAVAAGRGNDQTLLDALNKYAVLYKINTPLRIAHFLAQCAHESGGFTKTVEGGNYQRTAALGFSNFRNASSSKKDTVCPPNMRFCKQPNLFNLIYANSNGNGDENSGDGYKYRGGGYIQITGKEKYAGYTQAHNTHSPDDQQDFESNPELVRENIEYSVESAMYWWRNMGSHYEDSNVLADLGATDAELIMMGANVNGWYTTAADGFPLLQVNKHGIRALRTPRGFTDRQTRFNAIKRLLGL
ncbi:glycoside hydrolase family 19 protein [Lonepinella sp. MS14435]|uniref:glycoside hydrolase family 19 protein n=1 Tax=Lonepinella sp. MS14435 TaxID=3003618 RepID=UPI0036DB5CAB